MIPTQKRPTLPPLGRPQTRQAADEQTVFINRTRAFGVVIVLLFMALVARLWFLQIAHGDDFRSAAAANQARRIRSRAPRGMITDCHGILLAANRSRFAVYATPDVAKDARVLGRLASLLHTTPDAIRLIIQQGQQNPYDPLRVASDIPMSIVSQVEESRPFLPGISTGPEPVRWYPKGMLAAHLLGTMGRINPDEWKTKRAVGYFADDFLGKTGVERQYEDVLHGTPGGTDVQIDARGQRVRTLDTASAVPGDTVTLALDSRVQAAAEQVLRTNHFTGAAVAIDPRTGGVLAMASNPSFDPNKFANRHQTRRLGASCR